MEQFGGQAAFTRTFSSSAQLRQQFGAQQEQPAIGGSAYAHSNAGFKPFQYIQASKDGSAALFQALQAVAAAQTAVESSAARVPVVNGNPEQIPRVQAPNQTAEYPPNSPPRSAGSSERTLEPLNPPLSLPVSGPTRANDGNIASRSIAGVKLIISCNGIRGVAHVDQQIVVCHCQACDQRVDSGYERPLFRYERIYLYMSCISLLISSNSEEYHDA